MEMYISILWFRKLESNVSRFGLAIAVPKDRRLPVEPSMKFRRAVLMEASAAGL